MSIQSFDINNVDFNELNKYFSEFVEATNFDNTDKSENYNKTSNHERNIDECTNCGGNNYVEDYAQGIVVCTQCGDVVRTMFDQNPEWKQYDDDDKAGARCSQAFNVLLPQSSLGTSVGGYVNSRTKRLHSWVQMPYKERALNKEFKIIHDVCQKAGILKCVEDDTKIMYKMASECTHQTGQKAGKQVITRGVNRKSIIAACLFFACVRKGVTRTSKEIAQLWGISESDMNKGRRNLQKLFKIKDKVKKAMLNTETSKPEHFIRRFCNALQIKNQYIEEALKIAINIEKLNIASSHTPCSSAAASILLMAEINNLDHITKKKLANQFEISDSTIFETYKEMAPYKNVLVNTDSTNAIVKQINKDMITQEVPQDVLERMKKFGIDPTKKSQELSEDTTHSNKSKPIKKTESNCSFTQLILEDKCNNGSDGSDGSDDELEVDANYNDDDADVFFYEIDEVLYDDNDKQLTEKEQHTQLNSKIADSLQEKFASIKKIIKTKSLKDIKKEMKVLMSSYDLIKGIRNDLDMYTKNNF